MIPLWGAGQGQPLPPPRKPWHSHQPTAPQRTMAGLDTHCHLRTNHSWAVCSIPPLWVSKEEPATAPSTGTVAQPPSNGTVGTKPELPARLAKPGSLLALTWRLSQGHIPAAPRGLRTGRLLAAGLGQSKGHQLPSRKDQVRQFLSPPWDGLSQDRQWGMRQSRPDTSTSGKS